MLASIAEALDLEIARWEERSREDEEARAVLRAFLGLRELLWEFGVRPGPPPDDRSGSRPERAGEGRRPRTRRGPPVQRVRVEG